MQHKVADYQRHIDQLCKKYNIKVEWRENTRARAWRKSRQMRLCPIRSGITYAVALHELGHIHGPQTGARLNRETQAWIWAKETAICWHNPMNNVIVCEGRKHGYRLRSI